MVESGVAEAAPNGAPEPPAEPAPRRVRITAYGVALLLVVSIQPFAGFVAENVQEELPVGSIALYAAFVFVVALVVWIGLTVLLPRSPARCWRPPSRWSCSASSRPA